MDFSNCKMSVEVYGGASGKKRGIIFNGENYMLKFPHNVKKQELGITYNNSCISEYVGCHIFANLGFNTQETLLSTYNDKIVVACKDFVIDGYSLKNFYSLKNSVLSDENEPEDTELNNILNVFKEQTQFPQMTEKILKEFFWEMFIVDAFLANFDRHNGNWGFLTNRITGDVKFAPIFDCGSCLFPYTTTDEAFKIALKDKQLQYSIVDFPLSIIRLNREKINYFNFLTQTNNKECLEALVKITDKIDIKQIHQIVDETPYISDLNKEFLKFTLQDRQERLLKFALLNNKNIAKIHYFNGDDDSALNLIKAEFLANVNKNNVDNLGNAKIKKPPKRKDTK